MALGKKIVAATICGEPCHISTLTGGKQSVRVIELMQNLSVKHSDLLELGALLVCLCHCDESGNRTYKDEDVDNIREQASIGYLKEFTEKALEVSGLGEDAANLKNSEAVQ